MQTLIQCLHVEAFVWRFHAKRSPVASEDLTRLYDPHELYIQGRALKQHKPSPRGGIVKMALDLHFDISLGITRATYMLLFNTHVVFLFWKSKFIWVSLSALAGDTFEYAVKYIWFLIWLFIIPILTRLQELALSAEWGYIAFNWRTILGNMLIHFLAKS